MGAHTFLHSPDHELPKAVSDSRSSEHLIPGSTHDVVHFNESRPENSRLHIIQTTQKTETRGSKFKAHLGYIETVSKEVKEAEDMT